MKELFTCIIGSFLLLFSFVSYSQNPNRVNIRELQKKMVAEKMRITPGEVEDFILQKQHHNNSDERMMDERSIDFLVDDDADPESEIHAAINPTDSNNIVVSCNLSTANNTDGINPIYYTHDFGATWQKSNFSTAPVGGTGTLLGGGDPMFGFDKNGRAYFCWISLYLVGFTTHWDLVWCYSDDGGETWQLATNPFVASSSGIILPSTLYDKQWMAVDHSTSQYENDVYVAFFESQTSDLFIGVRKMEAGTMEFSSSSVNASGSTWANLQFCSMDVDGDGDVHVTFFATNNNADWALYHTVSTDGGSSFGTPVKISDVQSPNFSAGQANETIYGVNVDRVYPCPHVKADKSGGAFNGNVYAVWTANGISSLENNGADIYFSKSGDNGQTWSTATILNNNATGTVNDQFYPSIDVNSNGTVVVSFYDRREDTNNENTHYYAAWSNDGGNTWSNQLAVTSASTEFGTVGDANQDFGIGEYNQVVTTGHYALPFWSDGRNNDGDLNIYGAKVFLAGTNVEEVMAINAGFSIENILPNPASANSEVTLHFETNVHAALKLYSVDGKLISVLAEKDFTAGGYTVEVPVNELASGQYLLRLESVDSYMVKKLTIQH